MPSERNSSASADLEAILADIASPTSPASTPESPEATLPATPVVSVSSGLSEPVARKTPTFSVGDAVQRSLRPALGIFASAQEGARKAFSTTGSLGRALKNVPPPSEIFASLSALLRRLLSRVLPQKFAGNPALVGLAAGGVLVAGLVGIGFLKFDSVTVSEGIATSDGPSEGKSFLIEKTRTADQNDLVVGLKPGSIEGQDEELVMGTVFSKNEETYAVLGDNVVWQVPVGDLRGKVWFATPQP